MKILIAMDSMKGSLSSREAGEAVEAGIRRVWPDAGIRICLLADGGEGTAETLTTAMRGRRQQVTVTGPLGEPVACGYGISQEGQHRTAVMEMAAAAGLPLVPKEERTPLRTTTRGVGEMIRDAVERGCTELIIGIGGSATNDGGIGMLQALGWDFLDRDKKAVPDGAAGLRELCFIETGRVLPGLERCRFRAACDVTNPLCGPGGASRVFGPQKGADPKLAEEMDGWMERYAKLVQSIFPAADPAAAGSGAAGGLGFALCTFLKAELEPGAKIVMEKTGMLEGIREADVVVTGEGRLDGQTAMGKGPGMVASFARQYGKPVIALAGSVARDANRCQEKGIDVFFPIGKGPATLEEAMEKERTKENLADTAEQVFRLWKLAAGRREKGGKG